MNINILASLGIYALHIVVLPPLLIGFIRLAKARLQNRRGPSLLQPFWDLAKLFGKGETISTTTTWVFRSAPLLNLAVVLSAALMIPWLGVAAPISGDLILLVYLLALGKFATGLAALDSGSSFGALGASREAAVSLQSEPALLLGLAALAVHTRSSALSVLFRPEGIGIHTAVLVAFVILALWISAMAELSRMPIDDPTTHLELTMIHEALILENSGRSLALIEYSASLKLVVLMGLVAQVALVVVPVHSLVVSYGLSLALILLGAGVVAVAESVLVKLRWRRVPNLLSFAIASGLIACLFVALKG